MASVNETSESQPLLSSKEKDSLPPNTSKLPIATETPIPQPLSNPESSTIPPRKKQIPIDKQFTIYSWVYDIVVWVFLKIFQLFFREIRSRGAFRVPTDGAVIFVAAPHANQFIDPMLIMQQIQREAHRRVSFLIAEKSLHRKFIGLIARMTLSIGVVRAQDNLKTAKGKIFVDFDKDPLRVRGEGTQFTKDAGLRGLLGLPRSLGNAEIVEIVSDTELIIRKEFKGTKAKELLTTGTSFKTAPHVDQSSVYRYVFEHLNKGGCIGIFPEGGSHDRSDLLPIKAGVAIMALGALAEHPDCNVKIVAVGMNYFHPHKFRSRAVLEFGHPMDIPKKLVAGYKAGGEAKREAVKGVLDIVTDGLRAVTVRCSDWDTLMTIQAARRLYRPSGRKMPLSLVIELNRRLLEGYNKYKDQPVIISLRENVSAYNRALSDMGLKDHQVETASMNKITVLGKLIQRTFKLIILLILALPGTVLFSPVFVATRLISKKKAAEALKGSTVKIQANDVIATWKVLVAMGFAPLLYNFYALLSTYLVYKFQLLPSLRPLYLVTIFMYGLLPTITYAALLIGETGMDIFKSLRPLSLALSPKYTNALTKLQEQRRNLVIQVTEVVNSLGPELYPDFVDLSKYKGEPENGEEEENEEEEGVNGRGYKGNGKHKRSDSSSSLASTDSRALSRVTSESSLSNIPLFANAEDANSSSGVSRVTSASHSRSESQGDSPSYGHTSATERGAFGTEVSKRIRDVMEEQARNRS